VVEERSVDMASILGRMRIQKLVEYEKYLAQVSRSTKRCASTKIYVSSVDRQKPMYFALPNRP
jgi:hypothetical protein